MIILLNINKGSGCVDMPGVVVSKVKLNQKRNKLRRQHRRFKVYRKGNEWRIHYWSRGSRREVNGAYTSRSGEEVVCRQMAFAYLRFHKRRLEGAYQHVFSSQTSVNQVELLAQNEFDKRWYQGCADGYTELSIVGNGLGRCLRTMTDTMRAGDERTHLLYSENHAMAIVLLCKALPGAVRPYWVVKFYDPNSSQAHQRIELSDASLLDDIGLGDFLSQAGIRWYFPSYAIAVLLEFNDPHNVLPYNPNQDIVSVHPVSLRSPAFKLSLHNALLFAKVPALSRLLNQVMQSRLPAWKKLQLLSAKPLGSPGFVYALDATRLAAVQVFLQAIMRPGLTNKGRVKLMRACNHNGWDAFYFLLGNSAGLEIIRQFVMTVLSSTFLEKDRVTVLMGTNYIGNSALNGALFKPGVSDNLALYLGLIGASDKLLPASKVHLMRARDQYGESGWHVCFSQNKMSQVRLFAVSVLASTLSERDKLGLLACKHRGVPGLAKAFQYNHVALVEDFVQRVLNSDLSVGSKCTVLAACDDTGAPGLYRAFKKNNAAMVGVFARAVLGSDLPSDAIMRLLAARRLGGVPGLHQAMSLGYSESVESFVQSVATSALSISEKMSLMLAKGPFHNPGLSYAMQMGRSEVVDVYMRAVASMGLHPEKIFILFSADDSMGLSALSCAMQQGRSDAVAVFVRRVLASALPTDCVITLLQGESDCFGDALTLAFDNLHFDALDVYKQTIISLVGKEFFKVVLNGLDLEGACWNYVHDYQHRQSAGYGRLFAAPILLPPAAGMSVGSHPAHIVQQVHRLPY